MRRLIAIAGGGCGRRWRRRDDDRPRCGPYRPSVARTTDLGTWIDIYPPRWPWTNPQRTVDTAVTHGVRTLFVETSNYHTPPGDPVSGAAGPADRSRPRAGHPGRRLVPAVAAACRLRPAPDQDGGGLPFAQGARSTRSPSISNRRWRRPVGANQPSAHAGAVPAGGGGGRPTRWARSSPRPAACSYTPSTGRASRTPTLSESFDVVLPMDYATYHVTRCPGR